MMRGIPIAIVVLCVSTAGGGAPADDLAKNDVRKAIRFFETRVRPVLVERCHDCHSEDNNESGLRLDSLAGMLKGGKRGPAIVAGKPQQSLLMRALSHGERLQMPPKEKLPPRQIADFARWIEDGAVWPGVVASAPLQPTDGPIQQTSSPRFSSEQRTFWAFQPIRRSHRLPHAITQEHWVRSPIDAWIFHGLQSRELSPAAPADKRTLIRRATFDLIGLPPTPQQVADFLADRSPDAFSKVLDRLLASPHYGERWGRRWLDVARYADSNGLDENLAFANAFRYRDYVVSSLNRDKPYHMFIEEQLAGDLLQSPDEQTRIERRIATGFLSLGAKMLAEDDPRKMEMDIIDEQVDTLGRAVMGLTLGCARCHDHKFDPIATADYYALAGFFKSTKTMENFKVVARWQELPVAPSDRLAAENRRQQQVAGVQREIDRLKKTAGETILQQARRHLGDYLLAAANEVRFQKWLKSVKAIGGDPQAIQQPGVRLIEAEDYQRGNVRKDFQDYGKGIGVLVNQGQLPNFVEYDVVTDQRLAADLYQLEIRYAAASARPCKLTLNGTRIKSDAAGDETGGWQPENQKWAVESLVRLRSGKNVFRLEHPQFFPHIDKLLLAPARQDGPDAPLLPLSNDYQVIPALVKKWVKYLDTSADNPLLRAWRIMAQTGKLTADAGADDWTRSLLGASPPKGLSDLARRYQELSDRVIQKNTAALTKNEKALRDLLEDPKGPFALSDELEARFPSETKAKLQSLRAEKKSLESKKRMIPTAMAVSEGKPQDLRVHIRGNYLTLGAPAPRRFLSVLIGQGGVRPQFSGSGRLALARWITSAEHPLTARVMANRLWQGHFGEGLVRSVDNFGRLGEPPTHPRLLDWLAAEFIQSGWSMKTMHRSILLTSTYRMSAKGDPRGEQIDPENRLWRRANRRRLDAEALRDGLLQVSGMLDRRFGGSLLPTANRAYVTSTANVNPVVYQTRRRSIYLPVVRSALYDVFQAFDFPDPSVLSGKRQSTTVASQALFMMNSAFTAEQAAALAQSLLAESTMDDRQRIIRLYDTAYSRPPSPAEVQAAIQFLDRYQHALESRKPDPKPGPEQSNRLLAWRSLCRAVLSANEFFFVD